MPPSSSSPDMPQTPLPHTSECSGTSSPTSVAVFDFEHENPQKFPDLERDCVHDVPLAEEEGNSRTDMEHAMAETHDDDEEEAGVEVDHEEVKKNSTWTIAVWLVLWLLNNVALTLLNKATFAKFDFKYPYFLSFFHMCCNYIGSEGCIRYSESLQRRSGEEAEKGKYQKVDNGMGATMDGGATAPATGGGANVLGEIQRAELDRSGYIKILLYSVIFSLNVAIGNVSLRYVSVNFNQVMRSLVPAIAIALGACLGKSTSWKRKISVVPVVIGVAMACYGDLSFTTIGFVYTSISVFLAALKAVASGEMLTGDLKLHPVDLLVKMTPPAAVQCIILSLLTGELTSIASRWKTELSPTVDYRPLLAVCLTGLFSFTLNVSSLVTNKLTSPLTICIAANAKQVMMIALSTVIFETEITFLNGAGISVVLVGSAIYSYISMVEKTSAASSKVEESEKGQCDRVSISSNIDGKVVDVETEKGTSQVEMKKMEV